MEDKHDLYPEPYPLTPEERAAWHAELKAKFSAADLQRFTEPEDGVPFEDVINDLEKIDRRRSRETK